eukprot:1765673-Lingulodinium_polyedra.AAC.1
MECPSKQVLLPHTSQWSRFSPGPAVAREAQGRLEARCFVVEFGAQEFKGAPMPPCAAFVVANLDEFSRKVVVLDEMCAR